METAIETRHARHDDAARRRRLQQRELRQGLRQDRPSRTK